MTHNWTFGAFCFAFIDGLDNRFFFFPTMYVRVIVVGLLSRLYVKMSMEISEAPNVPGSIKVFCFQFVFTWEEEEVIKYAD